MHCLRAPYPIGCAGTWPQRAQRSRVLGWTESKRDASCAVTKCSKRYLSLQGSVDGWPTDMNTVLQLPDSAEWQLGTEPRRRTSAWSKHEAEQSLLIIWLPLNVKKHISTPSFLSAI